MSDNVIQKRKIKMSQLK